MAWKPVDEPYRSNNARWVNEALWSFWEDNKDAQVEQVGNEQYKRKNVGGGETRGENAKIILDKGTVEIKGVRSNNALAGHGAWQFKVISQGSKGSPSTFFPKLLLEPKREGRENKNLTVSGVVSKWECKCRDFKYRKNVCKHILACTLAMYLRTNKVLAKKL